MHFSGRMSFCANVYNWSLGEKMFIMAIMFWARKSIVFFCISSKLCR
jgi:hypothetical protein